MHPGALKILKFYPNLAVRAKMAALPPSLVPAIDTFVPATLNLNKNPVYTIMTLKQMKILELSNQG